ncbi:MAG TPA: phage portal protein [Flavobacteriales bacterium]|nr:phage portal protein [Flavobacteriales bacterium]
MKFVTESLSITKKIDTVQPGSWSSSNYIARKRKGLHFNNEVFSQTSIPSMGGSYTRSNERVLSDEELWTVYLKCSDVRASVDSIVRRVATFDWMVLPNISPQDERYEGLLKVCDQVTRFLQQPNKNGDTWQEVMTALLTDTLVMDAGVLELAYGKNGVLQELVPLRGSTIFPQVDEFGRIKEYSQNIYQDGMYGTIRESTSPQDFPTFKPNQIMFLSLFKNTAEPRGNPIIESIINEVIAMLRANEHAMISLDADEIPPGILVLAGIAGRAAEEARADMQRLKGQDHKIRVMTTPDPTGIGAKWIELKRTPKDVSMIEIIDQIRRAIYRAFGVMPVEMGMTESIPRATAVVQMDVASSHLVTPILELLQGKINGQILTSLVQNTEITNLIEFKFDREKRLTPEDQRNLATTHQLYVKSGVMTRNEVRETLGLKPVLGADKLTHEYTGNIATITADTEDVYDDTVSDEQLKDDESSADEKIGLEEQEDIEVFETEKEIEKKEE